MKVSVDYDMATRVHSFFEWIRDRAAAPEHADKGDLIADFVDRFLVAEMKRLENGADVRKASVDVPDAAIDKIVETRVEARVKARLQSVKDVVDKAFGSKAPKAEADDLVKAGSIAEAQAMVAMEAPKAEAPVQQTLPGVKPEPPAKVAADGRPVKTGLLPPSIDGKTTKDLATPRQGNGHLKLKKHSLSDAERNGIRAEFDRLNGQIDDDACLPIKAMMEPETTIFQVVGFVGYLHAKVAEGAITVRDMAAYEAQLSKNGHKYAAYLRRKGAAEAKRARQ